MPEFREKYGQAFPAEWTDTQIELWGYIHDHKEANGGLGKANHLRNAMMLLWPETYAGEQEHGIPRWRDEIEMMVWAWCNFRIIPVIGHASAGKCLGRGTDVLMYDGSIKKVEDVVVGDQVMGDDSTPRNVLSIARGTENMYRIVPSRGDPWVCNESHILSLKAAYVPKKHKCFQKGDVRDVPLKEFLSYGETRRRVWKQYRVGADFPVWAPLEVDPYIYGLWIGNGCTDTPVLCQPHGVIADAWRSYWGGRGAEVICYDYGTVPRFRVNLGHDGFQAGNYFTRFLKESRDDSGQKRIIPRFLTAARADRLALLAGIIDTDGTVDKAAYSITTSLEGLAKDYAFLARSLGFCATIRKIKSSIKSIGYEGTAYSVYVCGDVQQIPTKLKRAGESTAERDPMLQEIAIDPLGPGEYFGFTIDGNHRFLLGDFTVTHNTHTFAHIAMASYLADAPNSIITLTSTHLPGLKRRLWADVCSAANSSTLGPILQIRTHDMVIRPQGSIEEKYVISGIATDKTEAAVEKIQGNHSRLHQHLIIDEAQGTPTAVFEAAANLMTDADFRMAMLANFRDKLSELGSWCEPESGWGAVDPEVDLFWKTRRGGLCLRLDGMKSPNIKHRRTIFPFLIRQDYIDTIRQSYGEGSARWWIYVRGWPPPEGLTGRIFPENVLSRAYQDIEYQFPPTRVAALDPAFEGGDECSLIIGEYGESRGSKFAINVREVVPIKVQVSAKSDPLDYLIAAEVKRICIEQKVAPENFIVDNTGSGRGVCAILQREWSPHIEKCYFGGAPTERTVKVGDDRTAKDLFDRFVSELWFAARAWMEENLVGGLDDQFRTLRNQLGARLYETVNDKKDSVESKKEMRERIGISPDQGDAFCMLVELVRRKGGKAGSETRWAGGRVDERLLARARKYSEITSPLAEFSHN